MHFQNFQNRFTLSLYRYRFNRFTKCFTVFANCAFSSAFLVSELSCAKKYHCPNVNYEKNLFLTPTLVAKGGGGLGGHAPLEGTGFLVFENIFILQIGTRQKVVGQLR